ncbi:hypothetical protein ACQPZJ_19185 [Actinoplanes sp. CA-054009]
MLALVAAGLSWVAVGRAGDALDQVAALPTGPAPAPATTEPAAEPTTETPVTTGPVEDPPVGSTEEPTLNPNAEFTSNYTSQTLRMPSKCNDDVYIDLDEPRVGADYQRAELTYSRSCSASQGPQFTLSQGSRGSEVESTTVTPAECADRIRTSPLLSGTNQPLKRGQVFCVNTSLSEATSTAQTWKMALLSVSAVGQDGAVTFKVSAWDIPR